MIRIVRADGAGCFSETHCGLVRFLNRFSGL
jgi:hypothetical protein